MKIKKLGLTHILLLTAGIVVFISTWAIDALFAGTSAFRVFFALTLMLFVFCGLLKGRVKKTNAGEVCLLLFVLWALITRLWSLKPEMTATIIEYLYIPAAVMFMVTYRASSKEKYWRFLGYAFLSGCMVASVLVIGNAASFVAIGERVTVGDLNANYIAYCLVTSIPVTLALLTTKRHAIIFRTALIAIVATSIFATLITGSRGAMLAAILCILGFFAVRAVRNFWATALWSAIFGAGLFFSWDYLPTDIGDRLNLFGAVLAGDSSSIDLSGRADTWPIAIKYFENNPIIGIGAGAFKGSNEFSIEGHNVFITVATETGIVGLLLYCSAIIYIFYRLVCRSKTPEMRNVGIAMLGAWMPIAMTGVWEGSVVAWLVFGWLLAGSRHVADASVAAPSRNRRIRFVFRPAPRPRSYT